jgi:hypothetical protein
LGSGSRFKESEEEEKGKSRSMQEEEKLAEMRKEVATRRNQNLGFPPLFLIS